jgi:transposase
MHSSSLRWLVVLKRCWAGLDWEVIYEHLRVPISSQKRIARCYERHGTVRSPSSGRLGRPPSLSPVAVLRLLKRVVDSPSLTLRQHRAKLLLATGKTVSLATLCRVLHENNFSRQKVSAPHSPHQLCAPLTYSLACSLGPAFGAEA